MNLFTRAPRIGRDHIHGIWAEGDHDASLPYLDMFRLAVSVYGHVVRPNERLTGAQWIRRIRSQYSAEVPRNRAVLDVIERVMMVDHQEFADDSVLFNPYGQPCFRGRRSQCQVHARALAAVDARWKEQQIRPADQLDPAVCEEADLAMANLRLSGAKLVRSDSARRFDGEPLALRMYRGHMFSASVGPECQLAVMDGQPHAQAWHAAMQLLERTCSAQRGDAAAHTVDRTADLDVQLELVTTMARFGGYSCMVTYAKGFKARAGDGALPSDADITEEEVRDSMLSFLSSLTTQGWAHSADAPLMLARPAPLVNAQAAVQPFEELIHSRMLAWRVPMDLVDALADQARARRAERERG